MPNEKESLALEVLHATFEAGAEETASRFGDVALTLVLSSAIANPLAQIVGVALKGLVKQLLSRISKTERMLNRILAEPLETAVGTIVAVLSVRPTTTEERAECSRQLDIAFDGLSKARSYAQNESQRLVVRLYQCLVASLKSGGKPFVELYLGELEVIVANLKREAEEATAESKEIVIEVIDVMPIFYDEENNPYVTFNRLNAGKDSEREQLSKDAEMCATFARDLETFGGFVRRVSNSGLEFLQKGAGSPTENCL